MQNMNLSMTPYTQAGNFVCSQYDVGRQCQIQLIDENGAYTIPTGATVKIQATKPSGLGFSVTCTYSGSTVSFATTETMTNEFGRFPVELQITSGNTVLGTTNFFFKVEKSPHPNGTTDGDAQEIISEITVLVERAEAAAETAAEDAAAAAQETIDEILDYLPQEVADLKEDLSLLSDHEIMANCYIALDGTITASSSASDITVKMPLKQNVYYTIKCADNNRFRLALANQEYSGTNMPATKIVDDSSLHETTFFSNEYTFAYLYMSNNGERAFSIRDSVQNICDLNYEVSEIIGEPIATAHSVAQVATDELCVLKKGAYEITATGESVSITLYKTIPYSPSAESNISVVADYRGGIFKTYIDLPSDYFGYRFFSGSTAGDITITRFNNSIDELKETKENVSSSATYTSTDVMLGTFDSSTGVFTEAQSGTSYGSNYIPCVGNLPVQYLNGGWSGIAEWWLRFYYYDVNKTFIKRSDAYNMTSVYMANDAAPNNAEWVRIAFSYANSISYVVPFTINVGKMLAERTAFLYDKSIITIAASDSTFGDKMVADVVCDGVNDEVDIQNAINILQSNAKHKGGKIILFNGTYIIDSLYDTGSSEVGKIGIYLKANASYLTNGSITIEGSTMPNLVGNMVAGSCAVIQLSDTCFNSLSNNEKVSIIGGLPPVDSGGHPTQYVACGATWLINNLAINIQNPYKSIIGINAEHCWNLQMSNIQMARATNPTKNEIIHQTVNANEECIGLRTLTGLNNGSGYQIENVNVRGWGTGFDIAGEHMTMIGCCARINKTGFRFGYFEDSPRSAHPNVLINCCDEVCINGIKLYGGSLHPTIEFISYNRELDLWESTEDPTEKIEYSSLASEEVPGNYHGRITYAINASYHYDNYMDAEFWDSGSGINFVTQNLMSPISGATSDRPSMPQRNQMYFDTTINKAIWYINGAWVDAMGTTVS